MSQRVRKSADRQKRKAHGSLRDVALTPDEEAWLVALNAEKVSIADYLSLFQIPTEGDEDFVYMDLFPFQRELVTLTEEEWQHGVRAEFRIPKSRRRGVSMFWRAFFFERITRVAGWRGAIIAQSDPDAMMHLQSLHELAAQLPKAALRAAGIRQVKGSAREIAFKHGRFKVSSVIVKTASARGLGRGGQLNGVLQTERPFWAPQAKRDRSAFLGSCRNKAGNVVVDESSPNGFDEFFEDTMASERGENAARLIFLPSHHHAINRLRFRRKEDREKLVATLGKGAKKYGGTDETQCFERVKAWALTGCGMSEEEAEEDALRFIHWRRFKIDSDCGHYTVFHREEATTLEEAFSGAGRRVFPVEIMESWKMSAAEWERKAHTGTLVERMDGMQFTPSRDGMLRVFEPPKPGEHYCFGCDVAGGNETIASSGAEADFNVVNVKEIFSGRTVAQLRGHVFPKPFAQMLLELAVWYGDKTEGPARGYVETNLETVVALMLEDEDIECLGWTGADCLLTSERKVIIRGVGSNVTPEYGFRTTEKSKNYLVTRYERFMVDWGEIEIGGEKRAPVDGQTLGELLRFIRKPITTLAKGGAMMTKTKMCSEAGHDDCAMAEMLAEAARQEILMSGQVPLSSRASTMVLPQDSTSRRYALAALRGDDGHGYDATLGVAF